MRRHSGNISIIILISTLTCLGQIIETEPNNDCRDTGIKNITHNGIYVGSIVEGDHDLWRIAGEKPGKINVNLSVESEDLLDPVHFEFFWYISRNCKYTSIGGYGNTGSNFTFNVYVPKSKSPDYRGNEAYFIKVYVDDKTPRNYTLTISGDALKIFSGGTGTKEDPYLISTPSHLDSVRYFPYAHFKQISNINLDVAPYNSGTGWIPIGDEDQFNKSSINNYNYKNAFVNQTDHPNRGPGHRPAVSIEKFIGVYDGNGHTISNLYIDRYADKQGLFGDLRTGEVENLGLTNVNITGADRVGSFAGINYGNISRCYVTGTVSGDDQVGGIVGQNGDGDRGSNSQIIDCYSLAAVTGTGTYIGGFIGRIDAGEVKHSYSTGRVSSTELKGGFIGKAYGGTVSNCFFDMETAGLYQSQGGFALTTAQMKRESTFRNYGWSTAVWKFNQSINDGYPYLAWQYKSEITLPGSDKDDSIVLVNNNKSNSVSSSGQIEYEFSLNQNYPNPFNPTTVIDYTIPSKSKVTLKVYDVLGKELAKLVDAEKTTGSYKVEFDAAELSSGIYFYTLKAGNNMLSRKMILIK